MRAVHVVGGGPAGVMAAFAAMREGAPVRIFEKSAFPRHKVCGEFLSPAILPLLRRAGCEAGFLQLRPAVLSAMRLHFGTRVIRHPLPEPAYGVSRYELDRLLLEHAASAGAQVVREHWSTGAQGVTVILAADRRSIAPAGDRLFGFKVHFSGPVNDNVELYFFQNCYAVRGHLGLVWRLFEISKDTRVQIWTDTPPRDRGLPLDRLRPRRVRASAE
jgi:hypothetical protein